MEGFIVLSILASIMMILACINYMNIAVASEELLIREASHKKNIKARNTVGMFVHVFNLLIYFHDEHIYILTKKLIIDSLHRIEEDIMEWGKSLLFKLSWCSFSIKDILLNWL